MISLEGDRVIVAAPHNDTWRMDIRDAKVVGESLHFDQEAYLHDDTFHRLDGVACKSIEKLVGNDELELGMTTKMSPELDSDLLTRIE